MTAAPVSRFAAWCYYGLPVAAWIALALALSTTIGRYEQSIKIFYAVLTFFMPEAVSPPLHTVYGIVHLGRRVATVFVYAGLTVLLIRALQAGAPRLRRRTLPAAGGIGFAVAGADNAVRFFTPLRHGGWDDFAWEAATVLLTSGVAALFFAAKAWERGRLPPPDAPP